MQEGEACMGGPESGVWPAPRAGCGVGKPAWTRASAHAPEALPMHGWRLHKDKPISQITDHRMIETSHVPIARVWGKLVNDPSTIRHQLQRNPHFPILERSTNRHTPRSWGSFVFVIT